MDTSEPIYIIGAGAIGKALAVFLRLANRNVVLIRGSVDNQDTKTERIYVETDKLTHEAGIEITTLSAIERLNGIIVLANKSFGNDGLAVALKNKSGASPLVLLQNGLGVERPFLTRSFPAVYRCVLFATSQPVNDATVRFKPVDSCPIGIEKGNTNSLNEIVEVLSTPFLLFRSEENLQPVIWKKAIANCVLNTICSLLDTDNGIFHRNKKAMEIAKTIITECAGIAQSLGVELKTDEIEATLLKISLSSDGQLISTLQDIRNGRRTELETLNLEVVRLAENLNKLHEIPATKLYGELAKLKADINLTPS